MLKILCILHSYVITCIKLIWNGSFPIRKSCGEEKGRKAKRCKRIMEDSKLHDACNEKLQQMYQWVNKKRKVRKHQRMLSKSSKSNGGLDTDGEELFKFAANSSHFLVFWVLHLSRRASITFFDGFLPFCFCLAIVYYFWCFSLRASCSSGSNIIHL